MTQFLVAIARLGFKSPRAVLWGWALAVGVAGAGLAIRPPVAQLNVQSFLPAQSLDEGLTWEMEHPRETLIYRGLIPVSDRQRRIEKWLQDPEVEQVWDGKDLPQEARSRLKLGNGDELTWVQLKPGLRTLDQSQALIDRLESTTGGQGSFIGHSPTRIFLHAGKWEELLRVGIPSLIFLLILPWLVFRSPLILLGPVSVAVPITLWVFFLYGVFGDHFSYFSFTLVPMLWCLCTLDAVFFLSRLIRSGPEVEQETLERVAGELAVPCFLTSVTTALGMAALAVVSDVPVIQEYGLFALMGVVVALPLGFLMVATVYRLGWLTRCAVDRRPKFSLPMGPVVVVFTLVACWGIPSFLNSGGKVRLFPSDHPYQKSISELEEHFGSLFPIRFTVSGDSRPERLFLYAASLEKWLHREGLVRTSLAPWTGFENQPAMLGKAKNVDWTAIAQKSRGWIEVQDGRPTRVSFLAWSNGSSAAHFRKFQKYLSNFEKTMMAEFTVQKFGAFFVLKGLEQTLIQEMWLAFALCVLSGLFVVVVGAIGWGAVPAFALVNLMPVLGAMGVLGLLGFGAESALIALPCMLFGLVVDDSIHLYCAYRRLGDWQKALDQNLMPLAFTSLMLAGVFLIQLNSYYAPNRIFGLGGAIGVGLAYGWDRWVLPALANPQGRKFPLGRNVLGADHFHRSG